MGFERVRTRVPGGPGKGNGARHKLLRALRLEASSTMGPGRDESALWHALYSSQGLSGERERVQTMDTSLEKPVRGLTWEFPR